MSAGAGGTGKREEKGLGGKWDRVNLQVILAFYRCLCCWLGTCGYATKSLSCYLDGTNAKVCRLHLQVFTP